MAYALQWIRSLIFNIQMYIMMVLIAAVYLIPMLVHPKGAVRAAQLYCRWVLWTARWMVGLKLEVRGTPPSNEVMIAAKHQSFLDIIAIFSHVPWGKFIMKHELLYAPILGQYGYRMCCVPVKRGKGAAAVKKMVADVKAGAQYPGQLIIYPQGTRLAPGEDKPYKVGTALLYQATGQACVPVATNVGVFWPKRGVMRKPGTAVIEYLPPIEPGLETAEFMQRLEAAIEPRSNALMAEAGFVKK